MTLTHLSLFSGIGGLDLAAEMAGIKTVGQCEWADYPTKVLERHWPDVPRWRDIRTLTGESFYERTGLRTVDIISGGFPCQPFSQAGKRKGKEDDRYLWPEMLRVIQELKPTWVVGENVLGIVSMALDTVLSDLENEGYSTQAFVVPACGVDAPHRRYRVCIVSYADGNGLCKRAVEKHTAETGEHEGDGSPVIHKTIPYSESAECERKRGEARERGAVIRFRGWWEAEPNVGRVADGIPYRMDRIKCLGNAVVPQQFFPFFDAIRRVMEGET